MAGQDVAVVTGAARGIGLAVAQRLGSRGMAVAAVDVDGDALASAPLPADSLRITADVADDPEDWVSRVNERLGPPTVLVNNAAAMDGQRGVARCDRHLGRSCPRSGRAPCPQRGAGPAGAARHRRRRRPSRREFLTDPSASGYITGANLTVDGGLDQFNWLHHFYGSAENERDRHFK